MTGITSADRVLAWNIRILDCPPSNERLAGAFQSRQQPFLTWRDLFDDLFLCFDLESFLTVPDGALALWFRTKDEALINDLATPCVYFNLTESDSYMPNDVLSKLIKVGSGSGPDEDDDVLYTRLHLTLVIHDHQKCAITESKLDDHLNEGCAMPIELIRNPKIQYLPIPSSTGSFSNVATPRTSTRNSPAKRPRVDPPITRSDQSSTKCDNMPPAKFIVPPERELNVKKIYNGTCVISGNNTSWGTMFSGPAMETCHIIPKAMFKWYPWRNGEPSEQELWSSVNSIGNCMVMDSISHTIHDNRLLAVHPDSHRIRLFVPIKPLLKRNNKEAIFNDDPPSRVSLDWHYKLTVIENMCALFLEREGGAKRMPWREGPISVSSRKERDNVEIETQIFGPMPQKQGHNTIIGTGSSNFDDNAAQDMSYHSYGGIGSTFGTALVSQSMTSSFSDDHPPQYSSFGRKRVRAMSDSSIDTNPETAQYFAADLSHLLRVEAQRQANIERVMAWSKGRQLLNEVGSADHGRSCTGTSTLVP